MEMKIEWRWKDGGDQRKVGERMERETEKERERERRERKRINSKVKYIVI